MKNKEKKKKGYRLLIFIAVLLFFCGIDSHVLSGVYQLVL